MKQNSHQSLLKLSIPWFDRNSQHTSNVENCTKFVPYSDEKVDHTNCYTSEPCIHCDTHFRFNACNHSRSNLKRYLLSGLAILLLFSASATSYHFYTRCSTNNPGLILSSSTTTQVFDPIDSFNLTTANSWGLGGYLDTDCSGSNPIDQGGNGPSACFSSTSKLVSLSFNSPNQDKWAACLYTTQDCTKKPVKVDQYGCWPTKTMNIMSVQVIDRTQQPNFP